MKRLNGKTLQEALITCNRHKNYKVIIVFDTVLHAIDFASEIDDTHRLDPIPGVTEINCGASEISFHNGSEIMMVSVKECPRVTVCHEVILDDTICETNLNAYPMLKPVPYRDDGFMDELIARDALERHQNRLSSYKQLDDFLNSFVIY